jgi:O-acetyl-ADP-ribose deacetylase (regulator of RNase III)
MLSPTLSNKDIKKKSNLMIKYIQGDLLSSDSQALVNTVNCVGVMGKGLALQFKIAFPENYKLYRTACYRQQVIPGKMFVHEDRDKQGNTRIIVNFPTKTDWRLSSKLKYIEDGLRDLARVINQKGIKSIAIPPLGCGCGGLHWDEVKPLIEKALGSFEDVTVSIFEPTR